MILKDVIFFYYLEWIALIFYGCQLMNHSLVLDVDRTLTIVLIEPRWLISRFLGRQARRIRVITITAILSSLFFEVGAIKGVGKLRERVRGNFNRRSSKQRQHRLTFVFNHISSHKCNGLMQPRCVVFPLWYCECDYDCTWKSFQFVFHQEICKFADILNIKLCQSRRKFL